VGVFTLLQTNGGKDESNIVVMGKLQRTSQHGTQNVKTHSRKAQKTNKMSNMDPNIKAGVNSGADEG
jgi:hypothetical protein